MPSGEYRQKTIKIPAETTKRFSAGIFYIFLKSNTAREKHHQTARNTKQHGIGKEKCNKPEPFFPDDPAVAVLSSFGKIKRKASDDGDRRKKPAVHEKTAQSQKGICLKIVEDGEAKRGRDAATCVNDLQAKGFF